MPAATPKDGASIAPAQVLSGLARVRALFQARALAAIIGPAIWRTDKGDTLLLTADALKIIPEHGGLSA